MYAFINPNNRLKRKTNSVNFLTFETFLSLYSTIRPLSIYAHTITGPIGWYFIVQGQHKMNMCANNNLILFFSVVLFLSFFLCTQIGFHFIRDVIRKPRCECLQSSNLCKRQTFHKCEDVLTSCLQSPLRRSKHCDLTSLGWRHSQSEGLDWSEVGRSLSSRIGAPAPEGVRWWSDRTSRFHCSCTMWDLFYRKRVFGGGTGVQLSNTSPEHLLHGSDDSQHFCSLKPPEKESRILKTHQPGKQRTNPWF